MNYDSAAREFELITIWPYDDDTQLPGGKLVPRAGDTYILWNIRMPDAVSYTHLSTLRYVLSYLPAWPSLLGFAPVRLHWVLLPAVGHSSNRSGWLLLLFIVWKALPVIC